MSKKGPPFGGFRNLVGMLGNRSQSKDEGDDRQSLTN